MRTLPSDVSRCANQVCPLREQCARFMSPPGDPERQVYSAFFPNEDGTCDWQIPVEDDAS